MSSSSLGCLLGNRTTDADGTSRQQAVLRHKPNLATTARCGSGKKFKACHYADLRATDAFNGACPICLV
jgi:hypothetical protein